MLFEQTNPRYFKYEYRLLYASKYVLYASNYES